jgi:phage recombination protein Bet
MPNVVRSNVTSLADRDFTNQDLALIKRTVAADCNDNEFNLFISYCRALQLDPRRKQIYALVYSKDDPKKRKMSIIVGIDGFRSIAARTGNYRPDDEGPRFSLDPSLKSPTNPAGIISATVKVFQHSHGQWFPVSATAYWDEFAPIKDEWAFNRDTNKREQTGKKTLDGKWPQMPHLMLAKCAEAQSLRKAWPDNFSAVYAPEEMDQASAEILDPIEAVHQAEQQERIAKIGGRAVLFDFLENNRPLEPVQIGKIGDRISAFIKDHKDEPSQIRLFADRNRHGLREYWSHAPGEALEIKRAMEQAVEKANEEEAQ